MASENCISCGPCMFDDVTKDADRWYTNCEEGICEDCENLHRKSKTSRNHKVITIEDYRKIEHVSISQVCEQHGESLEWFCNSHDEVLCVACVPSKHKACSDVITISVYSANSRQSSALSDLEVTIEGSLRNVKQCIKNRESATDELEKQELAVKTMVLETRTNINEQLDTLHDKLINELRSTSQTCKSKYMKILQKLKSTEEMLTELSEQTLHMKQFSSDIQVFLGTRKVNKRIVHEVESIKHEINAIKDYELKLSIDSLIEKLSNEVEEFGKIMVSESDSNLDFRDPKLDQAQIEMNVQTTRSISNVKLQPIKSFQMKSTHTMNVRGCVILPNGNLLMTNQTKENILLEYSKTGEHINDIPVSSKPYDIAVVDTERIVVTYGDAAFLEIMNNNSFNIEKKISLKYSCMGVSHADGKLYVVSGYDTVQVLDLSGKQLESVQISSNTVINVKASNDRLFYTDYKKNTVHCCRLNGEELWQLECEFVDFPQNITVDTCNNAYVIGYISNNLIVIRHDGKETKTLLTSADGLNRPKAMYFDIGKRTLLICNEGGNVASYKVD